MYHKTENTKKYYIREYDENRYIEFLVKKKKQKPADTFVSINDYTKNCERELKEIYKTI